MEYWEEINNKLRPWVDSELNKTVVDLFAGCGGLSLGFEANGFETIGFEMNEYASNTYNKNLLGRCYTQKLSLDSEYPNADIVIGGPPCQPFSVGGKQLGLKDSRDGFPIFLDAVKKLNPELLLFENVRGMLYKNSWYLKEVLEELTSLGYQVSYSLLNTKHYEVPQNRERVIVIGAKKRINLPSKINRVVTAGQALGELVYQADSNSKFLTKSMDIYIAKYEKASSCINPRDLHLDKPARTLTCRNLAGSTGDMQRVRLQDGRRRKLTVREAARLQSFPDWFEFDGSETHKYNQIGNAVAPYFSYHLAKSIKNYFLCQEQDKIYKTEDNQIRLFGNEIIRVESGHNLSNKTPRSPYLAMKQYIDVKRSKTFRSKHEDVQNLINQTLHILECFGIPMDGTPRRLERMAIAFLACGGIKQISDFKNIKDFDHNYWHRTRDIIIYVNEYFGESISPGSYDDIRRQDLKLLTISEIVIRSKPDTSTNNSTRGYSINPIYAELIREYGSEGWYEKVQQTLKEVEPLSHKLKRQRNLQKVEVILPSGVPLSFSKGEHNDLQKAIIEKFGSI